MNERYFFVEHRTRPRQRKIPTSLHRERPCPTCGHVPLREYVIQASSPGAFEWCAERRGVQPHQFPDYKTAAAQLEFMRGWG